MNQATAELLASIHRIIDQAAQADVRGSITINFGGSNRIIPEYKLGLTETEIENILAARVEQKNLRSQCGNQNELRSQ